MKYWGSLLLLLAISGCAPSEPQEPTLFAEVAEESGVVFRNDLEENESQNIVDYLYFYNGAGVAVADFNNDNLEDIYLVRNQGPNELFWNQGDFKFVPGAEKAGVQGKADFQNGVSVVDINADGYPDLSISAVEHLGWKGGHEFYLNDGHGSFTEVADSIGLAFGGFGQQVLFFDADNDGDQDAYVLRHSARPSGAYHKSSIRKENDPLAGDRFLRNTGSIDWPKFEDVTEEVGVLSSPLGYGLSVISRDFNEDGFLDVYVANDFHENDYLYLNVGGEKFELVTEESFQTHSKFSMGIDAADFTGDGHQDLFTLDMKPWDEVERKNALGAEPFHIHKYKRGQGYLEQFPKNSLHTFRGNIKRGTHSVPVFEDRAALLGVESTDWSWGVLMEDFDGDGARDLFITNGIKRRPNDLDYIQFLSDGGMAANTDEEIYSEMPPGQVPNRAYRGGKNASLEEISAAWGLDHIGTSNGSAVADFNNDGRWDIVVNNLDGPALLYRNEGGQPATMVDFGGYNVRYRKRLDSKSFWNQGTRSWLSHSSSKAVVDDFGGGIIVEWPHAPAEAYQLMPGEVNKLIPGTGSPLKMAMDIMDKSRTAATPDTLPVAHREDVYTSFVQTPLLMEGLDELGPAGAFFDNQFFLGGSFRKAPAFLNLETGDTTLLWADRQSEDVATATLTLGNGKPALLVVTGTGGHAPSNTWQRDRLYLSSEAPSISLELGTNASSVAILDVNADGIDDAFVGERAVWNDYGTSPGHALYLGSPEGTLSATPAPWLEQLGMVTAAASGDVTGDGRKDLIVATDWGAVQLVDFSNDTPTITPLTENGWWRSITLVDLDEDGDLDVLAGGMGKNHGITVGKKTPIELFIKDFDRNGNRDFIYSYYNDGTRYPLFGRDELIKESVQFRKQYLKNRTFSGKPFDELFTPQTLEGAQHLSVEFTGSAVLWNQGGSWDMEPLPSPFQLGPIYASLKTPQGLWLAGGSDAMNTIIGTQESFCGGVLQGAPGALEYQPCKYIFRGSVKSFVPLKEKAAVLLNDGPALLIQP